MKNVFKAGSSPERNDRRRAEDLDATQQLDLSGAQQRSSAQNVDAFFAPGAGSTDEAGFFDPFAEERPVTVEPDERNSYELGFEDLSDNVDGGTQEIEDEPPAPRRRESRKKPKSKLQKLLVKLKRWLNASTANKVIAIGAAVVLVATIVLIVWLIAGAGGKSDPLDSPVDTNEVQDAIEDNYTFVDESEYAGTLLTSTDDAGESYLKDTLFIGDSNFARIVMYGYLGYSNVIGVESMGIQGVTGSASVYFSGYSEPVTITKAVSLMKPRRIIICFGTNNILSNDAQDFADAYDTALDALHEAYSYSDIIICAIPPLGENRSNKSLLQETVDDYNLALIKLAKEKGYTFLDTSEVLKGSNGYIKSDYVYTDGIHISEKGFDMFFKYVRTHAHIVEDTRPQPLGSIPTQVAPPKKEVEEGAEFDPTLVASESVSKFVAGGCKSGTGTTTATSWTFTVPYDAEAGTETNWANNLYSAYLAQKGTPTAGSYVTVSSTKNSAEYVFTVTVYPVATCATHTWEDTGKTSEATCGKAGTKEQKCKVCGAVQTIEDPNKPATGNHNWGTGEGWKQVSAATCGAAEKLSRTCTVCGKTETKDGTAATGAHTWVSTGTTAASCTEPGKTSYKCSVCGSTKTENDPSKPATGHSWGAWTQVTAPTCGVAGSQKRTCSVCHAEETQEIAATGAHTWGAGVTNADGSTTYTCSVCGQTKTDPAPSTSSTSTPPDPGATP